MWRKSALWLLACLAIARSAEACPACSAQTICCLPGLALWGGHVGLVIGVLSAFIERPFFSLAGVGKGALGYSIQANLLSILVIGIGGVFFIGIDVPVWMISSVFLSALLKSGWIRFMNAGDNGPGRFFWILLGNVVSAAALATLPLWMGALQTDGTAHVNWVHRNFGWMPFVVVIAVIVLFVSSFRFAPRRRKMDQRRGFEVIVPTGQTG